MKKIGLIGAMDEEVAIIKEEMTNTNEVTKAGMTFVEGDFYGIKTVAVDNERYRHLFLLLAFVSNHEVGYIESTDIFTYT